MTMGRFFCFYTAVCIRAHRSLCCHKPQSNYRYTAVQYLGYFGGEMRTLQNLFMMSGGHAL